MGVTPRYAIVRKNEDGSWAYLCDADGLILAMSERRARTAVAYLRIVRPAHTYAMERLPRNRATRALPNSNALSVLAHATWRSF